jgi:eukaryotic-like serine/threonine-protein kinase
LWNPVIGASFQLQHLRLALRAGEPRRVAVALATEAGYRSLAGERAYVAARSLLGEALSIGKRLNDPRIIGTAIAMSGMCGYLTGRWDVAVESGREGERVLRENCSGVSWELSVALNAEIGGLVWSGQWRDYARRLDEAGRDAQDRGDLNAFARHLINRCPLSIAADEPDRAAHDLCEAERTLAVEWRGRGSHIPHFIGLLGRGQIAIYEGRAAAEFDGLHRQIKRLRRSSLVRVETLAIFALLLEGTLSIAAAADPSSGSSRRKQLLRVAAARGQDLRRRHAVWSAGLAMLMEAGVEAVSGREERASARWYGAQRELERSGMRMYAAAAQYCGGVAGGDRAAVETAEALFRAQGVKSPGRMAVVLAPGLRV